MTRRVLHLLAPVPEERLSQPFGRSWLLTVRDCVVRPGLEQRGHGVAHVAEPARVSCFSCDDLAGIGATLAAITAGEWRPPVRDHVPDLASAAERERRAREVWDHALLASVSPVALYLASRGLSGLEASAALRYTPSVSHPQGGGLRLPAMAAAIRDARGDLTGVHRKFLTLDGRKAKVEPVKASMGLVAGGAVRLHPHDPGRPLVIGEGIESAASAGFLLQAPAWAAVSAGNLARNLQLPDEVRDVVIAADPDDVGEQAAQAAAERWQAEGRSVRIARVTGTTS